MYRLHWFPGNASLAPHILLRELGADFELVFVDRTVDAHRAQAYRALNPKGVIPTLEHDGWALTEAAAICIYLADQHAGAPFGSPSDPRERARLLEWLFYLSNTVQPELMVFHYPERRIGETGVAELRARAEQRLGEMYRFVDDVLIGRRFLLGETPSAADLYLLMLVRWARSFDAPPRDLPQVGRAVRALLERPAVQAALNAEQLEPPWV
jgi:glutathione S-transferase